MLPCPQAALESLALFLRAGAGMMLSRPTPAALQTHLLRPHHQGGALLAFTALPPPRPPASPTGKQGSDPFLSGKIRARAGAVWEWTAACVSIPLYWSPNETWYPLTVRWTLQAVKEMGTRATAAARGKAKLESAPFPCFPSLWPLSAEVREEPREKPPLGQPHSARRKESVFQSTVVVI